MVKKIITVDGGKIRVAECNGDHIIVAKYFYIGSLEP